MKTLITLFLLTLTLVYPIRAENSNEGAPKLIHDNDPMQVKVYQLQNGLTVYLSRNAQAPNFYTEIAVRTGSRNDPADCTGLAHYLEHLLFKGTQKMGTLDYSKEKPYLDKITELYEQHFAETDPSKRAKIYQQINSQAQLGAKFAVANDIDRIYKFIGGINVNAHTSYEETTYKVELPANQLERWAIIESERFTNPVFRLFHTELETVYEEKNQSIDSGSDQLYEKIQATLFSDHPYGTQTTLGETEHLKKPSIKRITEYFNKYYVPGNMAIFISGDIDPDQAIATINKHFGKWPKKPVPTQEIKTPAPLTEHKIVTAQHEGEKYLMLAWQTVPNHHPDAPALEVLDMILDNSVAGLFNLNLVQQQKVLAAGTYPSLLNEAGAQYLWASPRQGQSLDELEKLLLTQIEILKKGTFEPWIIPAITADLRTDTQQNYESNTARVNMLRDAFISRQPWSKTTQHLTRIAAVTKEDVVRVANKYFTENYVSGHLNKGKPNLAHIPKPIIDAVPVNASAQSNFAKEILNKPTPAIKPTFLTEGKDYQKTDGKNGVAYYTTENPSNDLFSITWTFPTGTIHSPNLELAISLLEKSGTKELSPTDLKKCWYQLSVDPSFAVHEDRTDITLSGLSSSYQPAMELLWQWIHDYNADPQTLTKLVADIKLARADSMEDAATLIHALSRYNRYGKNSIYLTRTSSENMEKLTPAELQKSLTATLTLPHTISYIGKLSEPQWRELTPELKVTTQAPPLPNRPSIKPKQPLEITFIHKEMAQAKIWIEAYNPAYKDQDLPLIALFNEYFDGGMSGIVFQELRESRGLAYSANGYATYPRWKDDPALLIGSIGTQADKTDKATTKFLELYNNLPSNQKRFTESQDALIERLRANRTNFRDRAATIESWNRRNLPFNPEQNNYQTIPTLTLTDLLQYHKTHIKNQPKRIAIIGDKNQINLEALKNRAPIKELKKSDIFTP